MKKILAILFAVLMMVVPATLAVDTGIDIGIDIETEDFEPLVWMCDGRVVFDEDVEPGRSTGFEEEMYERGNNYAFEGEQIQWQVLVMDKNGINKIEDVFATIGDVQGAGNDIEVNCVETTGSDPIPADCNARILEEDLTGTPFDPATQRYYECTLTVETVDSMDGEYWITVEAVDLDGLSGVMAENEYWYLNPVIALAIDGDLAFSDVRPGAVSYSETLLVGNDADAGSGVLLDMFISGTDFYDSSSSGAMCPTSNRIKLGDNVADPGDNGPADAIDVSPIGPGDNDCVIDMTSDNADHLCYFASGGAYSTQDDPRADAEGYVGIVYGISFNTDFYNDAEIVAPTNSAGGGLLTLGGIDYFAGNVLAPGAELAVTFKLGLPEPCNGDFDSGAIYFYGEAI